MSPWGDAAMLFSRSRVPQRYLRQLRAVNALASKYRAMSDEQLRAQTKLFREQLQAGKSLNSIKIAAFAVVREADQRVLGMFPFDVQVLGALVMQDGNVAEMRTGEGKTLTATMPMYLNGLTGPGNFLVTANEYLADRDAHEMGRVYQWLGLNVQSGVPAYGESSDDRDLHKIYQADIVYTTNSTLGFDYLMDNLAGTAAEEFLQGFRFALIDEVDAVLLDSASMPLIISGVPRVQSNLFGLADQVVQLLEEETDFERSPDHKKVWFTPTGITDIEHYLGITGLLTKPQRQLYRHLLLALRAHQILIRDRDYMVDEDGVSLLDLANGRKLKGMRLEAGLHQALEAKEHVKISSQTRTMASITFQNLFRMFSHLCGMTGTAMTDAAEFQETYRLDVVRIPTNKPSLRIDQPDRLFTTTEAKLDSAVALIKQEHDKGRPILIETGSVSLSDLFSRILLREQIPHNLLNAHSAAKEALIVKDAGQLNAVTVATSMAGRGTDISLGKGVPELGGLLVVGTERMKSVRVDNQLRGRAGRQGSPGASVFFVSVEDPILLENGPKWLRKYRRKLRRHSQSASTEDLPITRRKFKRLINQAQHHAEKGDRETRFHTLQYAEIMRVQRDNIYATRKRIMVAPSVDRELNSVFDKAANAFATGADVTRSQLGDYILNNIDNQAIVTDILSTDWQATSVATTQQLLKKLMTDRFQQQCAQLKMADQQIYFERMCLLKALDNAWIEQVDMLKQLEQIAANLGTAQHDPLLEYLKDGRAAFEKMKQLFAQQAVRNLLLSQFQFNENGTIEVIYP
ncbi:accessory Sec system translocase SecA2 [Lapidilactobacillus wuchangensis]|uniref:accessory Sec system translocase SecA2 n=1 Tax=Lapidilactobacillus wuchangensis TaxID=2486001 RepID=UPI001CDC9A01|nr:accessory Sec system translocase SecA2 [Lapidilactobacillus wuchangensis]